jgi:hypothetical protein
MGPDGGQDGMMRRQVKRPELPLDVLSKLVAVAFKTIRVEDDHQRANGAAYTPDERDNAERARGYAFNALVEVPGYPTFALLEAWGKNGEFDLPPERFKELAYRRAASDSEHSPWPLEEAYELEREFDVAPVSPDDLQKCAIRRFADMQHDLLNTDFAQGKTLKRLPNEDEVQNWVAAELKHLEKRAYSVERESVVFGGKAPDIRLRSKVSQSSMPIEIKVANTNTLSQLEDALNIQLVGRYLRDKDARRGVLLLVHQNSRTEGWIDAEGKFIAFPQVVAHLEKLARDVAAGSDAPQAQIAILDVSSISIESKARRKSSIHRHRSERS